MPHFRVQYTVKATGEQRVRTITAPSLRAAEDDVYIGWGHGIEILSIAELRDGT